MSEQNPQPRPGIDALAEHARWLLEQHDKRAEGARARAMGLLGVIGVTLGLVFTALKFSPGSVNDTPKALTTATVVVLLAAAALLVRALNVTAVSLPAVSSVREIWSQYGAGSIDDARVQALLGNDFLGDGNGDDPLTSAAAAANSRVSLLKWGVRALMAGYALLTALVLVVVFQ